jgi:hypothetical protein
LQAAKESVGFAVIKDKTSSIAMPHRVSGACLFFITLTEYVYMHTVGLIMLPSAATVAWRGLDMQPEKLYCRPV